MEQNTGTSLLSDFFTEGKTDFRILRECSLCRYNWNNLSLIAIAYKLYRTMKLTTITFTGMTKHGHTTTVL